MDSLRALSALVLADLGRLGLRLGTAESCTGGLLAAALTEHPGSSAVFERGFVCYADAAKVELLGVAEELLARHGAVSAEVARAMLLGLLARGPVLDVGVAVTGIAGPNGARPGKPVGTVFLAAARRGGARLDERRAFAGTRAEVREAAVHRALSMVLELVRS